MQKMVGGRWKAVIKPTGGNGTSSVKGVSIGDGDYFTADPAADTWNQGVTYNYTAALSLYPWSRDGQAVNLNLTSESWMQREDSTADCEGKRSKIGGLLGSALSTSVQVEWDNGC